MKNLSYNISACILAVLISAFACSRETSMQKEKAGTRVLKKEDAALLIKDLNPESYPNWKLPVQKGMEYISYVKYYNDGTAQPGDSVSAVIYNPSTEEYEIFTLGGQVDSMLGHRILGMPVEDKAITVFVPQWPGSDRCSTGQPEHHMDGDKHVVTFHQDCSTKDTSGAAVPGAHRRLQFEITVR